MGFPTKKERNEMTKYFGNYHLYYRLPYENAAVGNRNCLKYSILRSDTEKVVTKCDTEKEAEYIVRYGVDAFRNKKTKNKETKHAR